ncbi:PP2A regulatory subunit TAP46 isoform X4 [Magnolia sinica]|uniref:PP2A regulatory subunit TAP46 isoform X4 n=1 Tax=Magnolia sinica TaxID=86752 RepID=UPI00265A4AC1|nr:PP2A regulatory subunit TAP46 isoform X4 [Magnolia sinica]
MGEWKIEDMPLPALFEQARKIHSMASESTIDQETLKKACEALCQCDEMISKLGLFSTNESKDDVSTTNLKYLLVPFYLGELTEKVTQVDRIQVLKISQDRLKEFVSFCEALELLPEEELEIHSQKGPDTPASRRANKIARFRRQKAAESKLQEIKERKERRGRSSRAAALSTPIEAGEEDTLDDDGEEEREDGDKEFAQEVLDERAKKAESWHRNAAFQAQFSKPAQPITCATFAQDVIEGRAKASQAHEHKHQPMIFGPASVMNRKLTTERERMAAQVFQPGYRLPTMSIEEAGLCEMEMMKKWQERNVKLYEEANSSWHKDTQKSAADEDDDEAAEEKARAWDDWKDDHPRGAGNKKLTPCG